MGYPFGLTIVCPNALPAALGTAWRFRRPECLIKPVGKAWFWEPSLFPKTRKLRFPFGPTIVCPNAVPPALGAQRSGAGVARAWRGRFSVPPVADPPAQYLLS